MPRPVQSLASPCSQCSCPVVSKVMQGQPQRHTTARADLSGGPGDLSAWGSQLSGGGAKEKISMEVMELTL